MGELCVGLARHSGYAAHEHARIEATYAYGEGPTNYAIASGALHGDSGGCPHFPLPFRQWYDDLAHT